MPIINIMCSICTDAFINSADVYSTSCGHLFHFNCLNDWQTRQSNCPQCRCNNLSTHKVYLSFDESDQNVEKDEDVLIKLESSNDKMTELTEQLKVAKKNFLQIQGQYTKAEESHRETEEIFSQMNDSESDFLELQAQYTDSSELAKELEDRINQMFIQNECKSEELKLVIFENDSLKARLKSGQRVIPEGILDEKRKNLEQKLMHISEEFEKEIGLSTQLSIEKVKLQSCLNQLQNSVEKTKNITPKKNFRKDNGAIFKNVKVTKPDFEKNAIQNDDTINAVVIKRFPLDQITLPLEDAVIKLALKMKLSISLADLIKVILVDNKYIMSSKAQIYTQFKSSEIRDRFLSTKNNLINDPIFKNILIDDLHGLYMYAQNKLQSNGFNVFYKNYKIFAKKNYNSAKIIIQSKNQMDNILKKHKPSKITAPEENWKYISTMKIAVAQAAEACSEIAVISNHERF